MSQSKQLSYQLYQSVLIGDLKKVEELIQKGVDVNMACNDADPTPLCLAAAKGHVEIVKKLLQIPNIDVNGKIDLSIPQSCYNFNENTALHDAAESGHLEVVEALLASKKVDVNAASPTCGYTPLHLASKSGHSKVVQALLRDPNIQVNRKCKQGFTALNLTPSIDHEVEKVLKNVPGILVGGHRPNLFVVQTGQRLYVPDSWPF